MLIEDNPGFRQVFLDGRVHPTLWNPTWLGHSIGKWEKDTLVIDTTGFNDDRSWLGGIGGGLLPHAEMLHMTERLPPRRLWLHMTGEISFDDPAAFRKPVRENLDLRPRAAGGGPRVRSVRKTPSRNILSAISSIYSGTPTAPLPSAKIDIHDEQASLSIWLATKRTAVGPNNRRSGRRSRASHSSPSRRNRCSLLPGRESRFLMKGVRRITQNSVGL